MYQVTVLRSGTGEAVDSRDFEYGTWKEIGFWLDHYGYNDPNYVLEVKFSGR
jgi:hypothetical protein